MSEDWWIRVGTLLEAVREVPPDERTAFLDAHCDNTALRREVAALLAMSEDADDYFVHLASAVPSALREPEETSGDEQETERGGDPLSLDGKQVRRYAVEEHLGGGDMGVVYKARDKQLDRLVALKFLPPRLAASTEAKARFVREAKAASALDHPNIATVYEISKTENGQLFIAMAYYAGETLKKKIARGLLPVEEAVGYAIQIAEGLAQAHEAGIVHRDVKPANVMITEQGQVKLVDFGLAKAQDVNLTRPGTTLGTVAYMSPEQTAGEAVDGQTDLWSLGVLLYEMLTGVRPFEGTNSQVAIYAIRHDDPGPVRERREEVPPGLADVAQRCLRKTPEERYQDAAEVVADLRSVRDGGSSRDGQTLLARSLSLRPLTLTPARLVTGAVGLAVLIVLIGVLVWRPLTGADGARSIRGEPVLHTSISPPKASVAVLPLENLSDDPNREYFADGMTDAVIAELGQIRDLKVISRTSAMQYRASNTPLPQIAEDLNIDYIVDGAVFSAEDSVRITASLVDAATDQLLWTKSFLRPMRNIIGLQRELARAVAGGVQVELSPATQSRLAEAPEVDPEAYRHFQRGVELRDKQLSWERARGHFKRAVTIDSSFALAWAWLAKMHAMRPNWSSEKKAAAEAALNRALRLDSDLSEAHVARALIRENNDWDGTAAEAAFQHAIALNPNNREAHYEYGWLLIRLDRTEEAVAEMKRVLALDPLSLLAHHGLIWAYYFNRQYEKAIQQGQHALEIEPGHPSITNPLGHAYRTAGRYPEAEATYRKKYKVSSGAEYNDSFHAALLFAEQGQREKVMAIIEAKMAEAGSSILPPTTRRERAQTAGDFIRLARTYATLGDTKPAIDALENAHDTWPKHHWFTYLKVHPDYDSLRDSPRFQALVEKVGLDA